ncbi:ABC transporter substrate-binding protein [Asticcacaulis sp. AC460]|uniref:TRAP transporter substrate-binding protein DctP n=1 Tax=Asticcacaulis sp. AC460 TaxID=1282360 RepID=UPI0003C3EBA9|nr:TRAP transporter substrate-binding protein DctP [Asticcacaulis sp. AC460]ESQ89230.1 ABC transporter substrate-binding protein [Asticcacaulis sp. AC460]
MKRRAFLLGGLAVAGCAKPVADGVTRLTYATPYSPSHPFSRADQTWMKFVTETSGGSLSIRPLWSGSLLSSDQSMEELRHGVADIGLITPIYVKGGAHLLRIQAGFYSGVRTVEDQVSLYRCMEQSSPQFAVELKGLKVLAVQGGNMPSLITRNHPVKSLADLKGLRLRIPSELSEVTKALGADPVNMPMGEVYSALAKGIIDGVVAPADTFRALHFSEVAKFYWPLEIARGAYPARAMTLERFERLAPEQRAILDQGIAVWEAALAEEIRKAQAAGLKAAAAEGVQTFPVSPQDQATFNALYLKIAERNAGHLSRYGIDGTAVFNAGRASLHPDGSISCPVRT